MSRVFCSFFFLSRDCFVGDRNALPCVLGVSGLRCIGYFHATNKTIVNNNLLHSRFTYAYDVMNLYSINQLVKDCRGKCLHFHKPPNRFDEVIL